MFALGLLGIALIPERSFRLFAGVTVLGTFASFLVIGNDAWYWTSGAKINYWGASVIPLVYAFVPLALTLLPGAVPAARSLGTPHPRVKPTSKRAKVA